MRIIESNYKALPIPEDLPYTDLLLERCKVFGNKVALVDCMTKEQMTYNELRNKSIQMSSALWRLGIRKGDVLCAIMPNCIEYVVTLLAMPAIGGVMTCINPIYTPCEIIPQVNDSKPKIAVVHHMMVPLLGEVQQVYKGFKHILVVGPTQVADHMEFWSFIEQGGHTAPKVSINPKQDLALLPYSSGTTGLPKGVMISHYNIVSVLTLVGPESSVSVMEQGADTVVSVFPYFHIAGFSNIAHGINAGSTAIITPMFEFEHFLQLNQDYKCTIMFLPPPVVLRLAKDPVVDKYDLSSVRSLMLGAAPTSAATLKEIQERLNIPHLSQGYAMTENTAYSHYSPKDNVKLGSSGILMPGLQCRIVSTETGKDVNTGEDGEVWMRGPVVMMGYYYNAKATADTVDQDGWLHTGDIGHVDEDGHIFVVDRVKELIKYKGFQVPPAELEAVSLTHPDVADAAVIGVPDERSGELPRAYIVLKEGRKTTPKELTKYINSKLAAYKHLRGGLVLVDEIPKSLSGKILRRVLKDEVLQEIAAKKSKL